MIYGGRGQEVTQNCVAACSGSAASGISEVGNEKQCPELLVVAVAECFAVVHFADVHSATVANCSLKIPEHHLQTLEQVVVGPSPVQGSVLCPAECGLYAGVQWVEVDHQTYDGVQHH